jgi:SAM-dependent methyltransferase
MHHGAFMKKRMPELLRRDIAVADIFFRKYKDVLVRGDPFYNPNLADVHAFIEPPRFPGIAPVETSDGYYSRTYWVSYGFPLRPKGDFLTNRAAVVESFVPFATNVSKATSCRRIVDIGCGPGMLVEAFQRLGVEAWGIEVSEDAIEYAPPTVRANLVHGSVCSSEAIAELSGHGTFCAAICIEVLEHIPIDNLDGAIRNISNLSDTIIVSTPEPNLWDMDDKTHVNVRPRSFWVDQFERAGYVEDTQKGRNIFGDGYEFNQDTNMFVFVRRQ